MNIIFFCQSKSIDVFYQLYLRMSKHLDLPKVGFYVANLRHYEGFLNKHPDFEDKFTVIKEWEIYEQAFSHKPDYQRINSYEKRIGSRYLWDPVVTDRRLYMGRKSSYMQDYSPYFSFKNTMAVLDIALHKIDSLFQTVQPDALFTIYTATFGDCLGHMFAKSMGINSYDFRLSRLKNYIMLVDGVNEPPPHIEELYKSFSSDIPEELVKEAEECIHSIKTKDFMYEGVKPGTKKNLIQAEKLNSITSFYKRDFIKRMKIFTKNILQQRVAPYCYDMQMPGYIRPVIYSKVIKPLTIQIIKKRLGQLLIQSKDLHNCEYILYPLHTEPELVLSQFARPYLNQIEVIRNIRLSMPIGMKLFVKEHPLMFGRRPYGYYKKILNIPDVHLMNFDISSQDAILRAKMVFIIRGAIGLEAVIHKIPVVSIGKSMFDILPSHMFRVCHNMYELEECIFDMLNNYKYDHNALIRYMASVIQGSTPVNLITELLGKSGRYTEKLDVGHTPFEKHPHLDILSNYILQRIS
jgi:hypothetical protein